MANVKATDTVIIREMFKGKEKDLNTMLTTLKPETLKIFHTTLSLNWIPLEIESEIIQASARLLFPNDMRPIFKLGHEVAGKQFTGIYKFFLRIPSVTFIVKNVSASFNTMNDQGSARVDDLTSGGGTLVISGLPEMSAVQREYICGVVTCVLELTGVKNIKVDKIENDSAEWKWKISWG